MWLMPALAVLLAGCGSSSRQVTPPAAVVGGREISPAALNAAVRYAGRFYAAAYPGTVPSSAGDCWPSKRSSACLALRRQVLARLIQEQVVVRYARTHGISLSAADRRQATNQMRALLAPSSDTAGLYGRGPRARGYLLGVLERQLLVTRVENAVVPPGTARGLAYHLRKTLVLSGPHARQQALALATDGSPIPTDAVVTTVWQAPFRIGPVVLAALRGAQPGAFLGPFRRKHGYLVVEFLGSGMRTYSGATSAEVRTSNFQRWLRVQTAAARPRCPTKVDRQACALAMMKVP